MNTLNDKALKEKRKMFKEFKEATKPKRQKPMLVIPSKRNH